MADFTLRTSDSDLTVSSSGVDIATYAFAPECATYEGAKPYLHPLRALDGAVLTAYRPWDHRWHVGLRMTWTSISGQNFWGGPTFTPETGYAPQDNVGSIRHDTFTAIDDEGDEVAFTETLTWITQAGDEWLTETRTHRFHGLDAERGVWLLDFSTTLRNVSGRELHLGSPTTEGRPNAGYTGYAIRMPRAWTGGRLLSADTDDADALMGAVTPWIALSGEHDEVDGGATVIAYAGTSTGTPPIKWFVRSEPFPIMSPSASFDEEIALAPGDEVSLTHRHAFLDRILGVDETRALAEELAP